MKKNKNEAKVTRVNVTSEVSTDDIIKMLVEYSLMYKTPMDNYDFISNLQQKIMMIKDK